MININKKGFTLIELLSTIAIMGIIATMTSVNIMQLLDDKKDENAQNKNSIISTAACIYIELEENANLKETCLSIGCDITSDNLIDKGLINAEDVDNPKVIHISKENNIKKCVVKED